VIIRENMEKVTFRSNSLCTFWTAKNSGS